MSAILELNLKAKRTIPIPEAPKEFINKLPNKGMKLELGKCYILNNGTITEPMQSSPNHPSRYRARNAGVYRYWDIVDGCYSMFDLDHPRSVLKEWHETWQYEKAWLEGKQIQVKLASGWANVVSYKQACVLFGPDSLSTKNFWKTKVTPYGVNNMRLGGMYAPL